MSTIVPGFQCFFRFFALFCNGQIRYQEHKVKMSKLDRTMSCNWGGRRILLLLVLVSSKDSLLSQSSDAHPSSQITASGVGPPELSSTSPSMEIVQVYTMQQGVVWLLSVEFLDNPTTSAPPPPPSQRKGLLVIRHIIRSCLVYWMNTWIWNTSRRCILSLKSRVCSESFFNLKLPLDICSRTTVSRNGRVHIATLGQEVLNFHLAITLRLSFTQHCFRYITVHTDWHNCIYKVWSAPFKNSGQTFNVICIFHIFDECAKIKAV